MKLIFFEGHIFDDEEDIRNQLKIYILTQKQQTKTLNEILSDILDNEFIDIDDNELEKLI
jgi:hypothetical protein